MLKNAEMPKSTELSHSPTKGSCPDDVLPPSAWRGVRGDTSFVMSKWNF